MADVFISYSRINRDRAAAIKTFVESCGWTVWWDENLYAGDPFTAEIQRALDEAGCLVVLWSADSVESDWVLHEANRAVRSGRLVSTTLDKTTLPGPFDMRQALDLSSWDGSADSPDLEPLRRSVAFRLEPPTTEGLARTAARSMERLDAPLLEPRTTSVGDWLRVANLFARLIRRHAGVGFDPTAGPPDLFGSVANDLADRPAQTVLRITGPAGTCPTEFVASLYRYQLARYEEGSTSTPYPLWLDLYDYEGPQGTALLDRYAERLDAFVERHRDVTPILCLVGFECFTEHRSELQHLVAERTRRFRRIVAVELGATSNPLGGVAHGPIPGKASRSIRLAPVGPDQPAAAELRDAFVAVIPNGPTAADIDRMHRLCHFEHVDLGTLSAAAEMCHFGELAHAGDYLRQLASDVLQASALPRLGHRIDDALARASELAYAFEINGTIPTTAEQASAEWHLVHRSSDMQHFLVANHLAECAMSAEPTPAQIAALRRPYPHQTTRFTRDVVNASKASKIKFAQRAEAFFDTPNPDSVSIVSFLLGRLEGIGARQQATSLLTRTRDRFLAQLETLDDSVNVAGLLFSLRSVYVSLIYLGDTTASDQYVGRLLDDPRWDRINRGFHLEYYGDLEIVPPDAAHVDPAGEFARTYKRLSDKIAAGLATDRQSSFDLDVYTLYSLAQHRHRAGNLEANIRQSLLELVPQVVSAVSYARLRMYLQMIGAHLGGDRFSTGATAERLYRVKATPRQGWLDRGLDCPESVADHMYGGALLAFMYLPLSEPNADIDRDRIIKMLLIHDLAEAETGDIVNKDAAQQKTESDWFVRTATQSTYVDLAGIRELGDLWTEYEEQLTLDARLAKDFDRLDQLTQLYIYRNQIHDFERWRDGLISSISTEQGLRVLGELRSHFDLVTT